MRRAVSEGKTKTKQKEKKIHFRSGPSDYTKYDQLWETTDSDVITVTPSELGRKKTLS